MIFATALPLAPPISPPTIAWDVAVLIVAGGILAYQAIQKATEHAPTDVVSDTTDCPKKPCPPCVPPVGTVAYEIHRVPPSKPHFPCAGDHVHWFMRMQNPNNCQCFWKRNFKPPTCLSPGEVFQPPPGAVPM